MNIKDLALKIDELSSNFKIGNLQEIRKNLKNLKIFNTVYLLNAVLILIL